MSHKFDSYLKRLKRRLREDEDFAGTNRFFEKKIATHKKFKDLSVELPNALLDTMIETATSRLLGKSCKLQKVQHFAINTYKFLYGYCQIEDRHGHIFVFADINVGMYTLYGKTPLDNTDFFRLTTFFQPEDIEQPYRSALTGRVG